MTQLDVLRQRCVGDLVREPLTVGQLGQRQTGLLANGLGVLAYQRALEDVEGRWATDVCQGVDRRRNQLAMLGQKPFEPLDPKAKTAPELRAVPVAPWIRVEGTRHLRVFVRFFPDVDKREARTVLESLDLDASLIDPVTTEELAPAAARPLRGGLYCDGLARAQIEPPRAIRDCLAAMRDALPRD